MKKILLFSAISLAILGAGCSSEEERFGSEGIGRVVLSPVIKSEVTTVNSRAVAGEDNLRESLILWVSTEDKVIRKYKGASSIPDKDWLPSGEYLAEAWAGDSVSATFDSNKRWFKGSSRFSVSALQTTQVQIPCKIANVLVDMMYESDLLQNLRDLKIVVGHSQGELEFAPDSGVGYFMMPSTDKDLKWTLTATRVEDGVAIKKSGVIKGAKPATRYTLMVHANVSDDEVGGAFFGLTVNTSMKPVYDEFTVEIPPVIEAYGFTANEGAVFKEGQIGDQSIFIIACADIASAKLTLDGLSELLGGITDRQGNPFETIDFITIGDDMKAQIEAGGIDWVYEYYDDYQSATLKVNFREKFTNNLKEGEYDFIHEITDTANPPRTTNQTIHVRVSNDILNLLLPEPYDVWPTKATVSAVAMQEEYGNVGFEYRKSGDAAWISATATPAAAVDGKTSFNAVFTSLTPGTTYEYRVISDMDNYASNPLEFTTEAPLQLPNAGFENWSTGDKNVKLPFGAGEDKFWDSGNHGSITLGINVTEDDSSIKHSGDKSIKLASANVTMLGMGKFAAGNVFVGEYLKTDGTDGILGWGRPFASRPSALKGYIKYRTGKLDSKDLSKNIGNTPMSQNDNDQGIIYVAILDNSVSKTAENKSYPVIIKTKASERSLFSQDDPNVLGYGQQVWTENTEGEGMIPFTIPINYDGKPHNVPSYILLTCSASRYGDFFVGSTSAEMWIDDLELVYE